MLRESTTCWLSDVMGETDHCLQCHDLGKTVARLARVCLLCICILYFPPCAALPDDSMVTIPCQESTSVRTMSLYKLYLILIHFILSIIHFFWLGLYYIEE